jgi:glutathione S-transferase
VKIYGYRQSINVRKVLWICEELQLPYKREDWGGGTRATADPCFRALNPLGLVPVIDDEGVIVWESNTILRYLAASRQRTDLLPKDAAARAHIEQWMDWQVSDFNNTWRVAFQALVRKNPNTTDSRAIENSLAQFSQAVGMLDAQLAITGAYISGVSFTLADIAIGLSVHRWYSMPVARPSYRHVERYYERLQARRGFELYGVGGEP